jgi:hypothetical protein
MQLLKDYFKLEQAIHDYFGYVEDWVTIPLDDHTDDYWMITGPEDRSTTSVVYSPTPFTMQSIVDGNTLYGGRIYTQRFLNKWVYRAKDYTMVCVDTECDGNKYLMVFDNTKETKDAALMQAYKERWGLI